MHLVLVREPEDPETKDLGVTHTATLFEETHNEHAQRVYIQRSTSWAGRSEDEAVLKLLEDNEDYLESPPKIVQGGFTKPHLALYIPVRVDTLRGLPID